MLNVNLPRVTSFALLLMFVVFAPIATSHAQDVRKSIATARGPVQLDQEMVPPRIPATEETDQKRTRSYPEQPPTIPHKIDGYQLDKNGNKCSACHARSRVSESGAPMISMMHFMDRDGQSLATVSPRRYFCNQCHVVQERVAPLMKNNFVDIDTLFAISKTKLR